MSSYSNKKKKIKSVVGLEDTHTPTPQSGGANKTMPHPTSPALKPQKNDSAEMVISIANVKISLRQQLRKDESILEDWVLRNGGRGSCGSG